MKAVWLDCDPGHDDAMAIILAGHSPGVQLLGISTVAGNQTLEKVTNNALDILDAAGISNVGHRLLPRSPKQPMQGKAVNVMFEAIARWHSSHSAKVHLVCTGALTNAALLLSVYPEVAEMIQVSIMGGCMGIGNTGSVMEFNIQVDPEAAHVVFESGVPLAMVPLEVTHTALATDAVLSQVIDGKPTPFRQAIVQLLLFFANTYREVFKFQDPPLHDPCAVAYVIAPHIFEDLLVPKLHSMNLTTLMAHFQA